MKDYFKNEEKFYESAITEILSALETSNPAEKKKIIRDLLFNTWLKRQVHLDYRLTERMKLCLLLASHGLLANDISKILKISAGTVRNYEKEIIRRLEVKNMKQAVAIGIKYGYLPESKPTV